MSSDDEPRTTRTRQPMLIGFLIGCLVGVGGSLAVAMFVNRLASPFAHKQANGSAAGGNGAAAPATAHAPAPPNAQEQMASVAGPAAMVAPANKQPTKSAAVSVDSTHTQAGGRNFLQVGSFVSSADADNRKAKLALLGFEAMVRAVEVPDKGTVHRVIVGPFATQAELDEAKAELAANNYASSLISRQAMAGGQ